MSYIYILVTGQNVFFLYNICNSRYTWYIGKDLFHMIEAEKYVDNMNEYFSFVNEELDSFRNKYTDTDLWTGGDDKNKILLYDMRFVGDGQDTTLDDIDTHFGLSLGRSLEVYDLPLDVEETDEFVDTNGFPKMAPGGHLVMHIAERDLLCPNALKFASFENGYTPVRNNERVLPQKTSILQRILGKK